ncbi:MAG TPA: aminotransferase class III-fold pyridoxal phosphate-dependent enzyme [Steroidobacteraceae bacterium]|nr:aminotransferase class III-fold pyridoxal phosphate-dependent enzyme [Steroidobacteraceae bacterium]
MSLEGLLALRAQPPRVEADEAVRVAREVYGLKATVKPLEGERDRNFLLDTDRGPLVLKFLDREASETIVAGQSAALAHLAEQAAHLPVPRAVPTLRGEPTGIVETRAGSCRVRLVTWLPGRLLQPPGPDRSLLHSLGGEIAALDEALQGFNHPALAQPIVWDVRHAPRLSPLLEDVDSPSTRTVLAEALRPLPALLPKLRGLRAQAIHGDCHPRNLLVSETGDRCTGIIDLGDMIHAPLALEIAVAMSEFLSHGVATTDTVADLLAGFTSRIALTASEVDVLYDLIAARIAIGALILVWRERHGVPTSPGEQAQALAALERLGAAGRTTLTQTWHEAARTVSRNPGAAARKPLAALLERRHSALGANAELSYDRPVNVVRGDGVWIHTADGERLLDVYNNVPHVGHAHPAVVAAIATQAGRIASNTRYLDTRILDYVERLRATLPAHLDTCLFVNSGSEANDIAWRIAKSYTRQSGALVMNFAYHGITDAVTALSPSICKQAASHVEQLAPPASSLCTYEASGAAGTGGARADTGANEATAESAGIASARVDVEDALTRLEQRGFGLAAFMIDSALTSSGIYDPRPEWMTPIVAAVRAAGGLIIGDEVQFGLGRSGSHFWGFARRGYQPDIVTLGKPVGNGYPLGVVITRRDILDQFLRDTGFFSTFGGNPVAAAAGLAVLDVLERERLMDNARSTGRYFIDALRDLTRGNPAVGEVRGSGLMVGVQMTDRPGRPARACTRMLVNRLRERGVLIGSEGPSASVLKLRPPMPFRPEHADIVIAALRSALSDA